MYFKRSHPCKLTYSALTQELSDYLPAGRASGAVHLQGNSTIHSCCVNSCDILLTLPLIGQSLQTDTGAFSETSIALAARWHRTLGAFHIARGCPSPGAYVEDYNKESVALQLPPLFDALGIAMTRRSTHRAIQKATQYRDGSNCHTDYMIRRINHHSRQCAFDGLTMTHVEPSREMLPSFMRQSWD